QAVVIDVDEVASFDLAVTDASPEDEGVIGGIRGSDLAGVAEVLEYLADRAQQRPDLYSAFVWRVHDWAAEDDVVGEEGNDGIYVAALNRIAELLHLGLLGLGV
ncbi:MAG TPA: hypothetical protein VGI56_04690, partial [Galbitalea sp.]